jgi:hypothetical protein
VKQPIDRDRNRAAKLSVESANSGSFTEKPEARPMERTLRTLPPRAERPEVIRAIRAPADYVRSTSAMPFVHRKGRRIPLHIAPLLV